MYFDLAVESPGELRDEPALADAGRPDDAEEGRLPCGEDLVPCGFEALELGVAAHERVARFDHRLVLAHLVRVLDDQFRPIVELEPQDVVVMSEDGEGASGKTFGMAVFGVRVVQPDGTDASWRQAIVRTLALPLSFLLLGLGFLGILVGDRRRALHDVIAGTAVVYSWDARAARLRFLSRS